MSDAATEATRLAPAGRACSKFVWQSRFLENWAVRVLAYSGRPAFLTINNHPTGIADPQAERSSRLGPFDPQLSIRALPKRGSYYGLRFASSENSPLPVTL